jgi:hypothetical protein
VQASRGQAAAAAEPPGSFDFEALAAPLPKAKHLKIKGR